MREHKGEIVFLRSWSPAARTAHTASKWRGSPACRPEVVARAGAILRALEAQPAAGGPRRTRAAGVVGRLRRRRPLPGRTARRRRTPLAEIADALQAVDPDDLSPRAAHQLLVELKRKLTSLPLGPVTITSGPLPHEKAGDPGASGAPDLSAGPGGAAGAARRPSRRPRARRLSGGKPRTAAKPAKVAKAKVPKNAPVVLYHVNWRETMPLQAARRARAAR